MNRAPFTMEYPVRPNKRMTLNFNLAARGFKKVRLIHDFDGLLRYQERTLYNLLTRLRSLGYQKRNRMADWMQ